MNNNIILRDLVFQLWQTHCQQTFLPNKPENEFNNLKQNTLQTVHYQSFQGNRIEFGF